VNIFVRKSGQNQSTDRFAQCNKAFTISAIISKLL
jgi:hypothetical protein